MKLAVVSFALYSTLQLGLSLTCHAGTIHNFEEAVRVIHDRRLTRLDQVLPYLDRSYLSNFELPFHSQSSNRSSLALPRTLLNTPDATQIVAYDGKKNMLLGDRLEFGEWDEANAKLQLRAIEFSPKGKPKFFDEPKHCVPCHATPENPTDYHYIWDTYPEWPGVYGMAHNGGDIFLNQTDGISKMPIFEFEVQGLKQLVQASKNPDSRHHILNLSEFIQQSQYTKKGEFKKIGSEFGGSFFDSTPASRIIFNSMLPIQSIENIETDYPYLTAIDALANLNTQFSASIQILNGKRIARVIENQLAKIKAGLIPLPKVSELTEAEITRANHAALTYHLKKEKRIWADISQYGTEEDQKKMKQFFGGVRSFYGRHTFSNLTPPTYDANFYLREIDGIKDPKGNFQFNFELKKVLKTLGEDQFTLSSVKGNLSGIDGGPLGSLREKVRASLKTDKTLIEYLKSKLSEIENCNEFMGGTPP